MLELWIIVASLEIVFVIVFGHPLLQVAIQWPCVVCGPWSVACGVWYVVCGVWCVAYGVRVVLCERGVVVRGSCSVV